MIAQIAFLLVIVLGVLVQLNVFRALYCNETAVIISKFCEDTCMLRVPIVKMFIPVTQQRRVCYLEVFGNWHVMLAAICVLTVVVVASELN